MFITQRRLEKGVNHSGNMANLVLARLNSLTFGRRIRQISLHRLLLKDMVFLQDHLTQTVQRPRITAILRNIHITTPHNRTTANTTTTIQTSTSGNQGIDCHLNPRGLTDRTHMHPIWLVIRQGLRPGHFLGQYPGKPHQDTIMIMANQAMAIQRHRKRHLLLQVQRPQ